MLGHFSDEWLGLSADLKAELISPECMRRIERRSAICERVDRYLGFSHDVFIHKADLANRFEGLKADKLAKAHLYGGEMRRIPHMLNALANSVGLTIVFPFLEPEFLEYAVTIPATLKRRKYLGKKLAERHIARRYVHRPKIDKGIPYRRLFTEEMACVEMLHAIRKARYYAFDVDEMLASQDYPLLLRLINFHIWKGQVLDPA